MAKKKPKANRPQPRQAEKQVAEASKRPGGEWDSVETEFFARAADLYRTTPIETFDDLDKD